VSLTEYFEHFVPKADPCHTEFKEYVNALASKKLESDKKLSAETSRYWNEILNRTFKFDRVPVEVDELYRTTQQEVMAFFEKYILVQSVERKKLSIQVFGNKHLEFMKQDLSLEVTESGVIEELKENRTIKHIVDVKKFKQATGFYPFRE